MATMGRPRKKHLHLPPRMQLKHGRYFYTPHIDGKVKWVSLSRDYAEALSKWAELEGTLDHVGTTVGEALDRYLIQALPSKSEATQREYRKYSSRIRAVFGDTALSQVRPTHIAQYLDRHHAPVMANREITMLSSIYQQAMRWGWVDKNPCRGVSRNTEKPRRRHITDAEIVQLRDSLNEQLRCIVDLVLFTALRKKDVLAIRLSDLRDDGLYVEISKTGRRLIFEWTPALRKVVSQARALRRRVGSLYLFATRRGQPYTTSGFDSIWQRVIKRSGLEDFRFHDLRARALTDAKRQGGRDYAQALADHQSGETTERYIRGREIQKVRPLR